MDIRPMTENERTSAAFAARCCLRRGRNRTEALSQLQKDFGHRAELDEILTGAGFAPEQTFTPQEIEIMRIALSDRAAKCKADQGSPWEHVRAAAKAEGEIIANIVAKITRQQEAHELSIIDDLVE